MTTETPIPPDHFDNIVIPSKKPRKKIRFTSREQILARIDKFTKKAVVKRNAQRQAYTEAGQFRRVASGDESLLKKAMKKDQQGDKLGVQADRLEKDVLGALKSKLSEFDTETIPGLGVSKDIPGI